MHNGDCGLLIYNYIIWHHISNLTSEIRFPKFCLSFQSAKNRLLDRDVLWRSRTRSFMLIIFFNSWLNPSGCKVFSFKIQKSSLRFKSVLVSSRVVCFLICSIKVNSACCWKLWFCLLKCLHAEIEASDLASVLLLLRWMLKVNVLKLTYTALEYIN